MVSVLLAMVVAALLTKLVYDQFDEAMKSARIEDARYEIKAVVFNAQRTFGTTNRFALVNTAMGIQSHVIPQRMHANTTTANNVFGQTVALNPVTIDAANDGLRLTYPAPAMHCIQIALGVEPVARRIQVGTTTVKATDVPIDLASLGSACGTGGPNIVNLHVDFGRQ